jgi:hypothetical protein
VFAVADSLSVDVDGFFRKKGVDFNCPARTISPQWPWNASPVLSGDYVIVIDAKGVRHGALAARFATKLVVEGFQEKQRKLAD